MEYAKDIVLDFKTGQEATSRDWRRKRNRRKKYSNGIISKLLNKMLGHKMMTAVLMATIGFMAIDIFLVTSFINVLSNV